MIFIGISLLDRSTHARLLTQRQIYSAGGLHRARSASSRRWSDDRDVSANLSTRRDYV